MLQGVGAGMTLKQVCLLASFQVLGGEDLFVDPSGGKATQGSCLRCAQNAKIQGNCSRCAQNAKIKGSCSGCAQVLAFCAHRE
jgi:hypothetical protein